MPTAEIISDHASDTGVKPFYQTLEDNGLVLERGETSTLQINIGLKCNQQCAHCHLDAGPHRKEMMTKETMAQVAAFAEEAGFHTIDITGGAPELHHDLLYFIELLSGLSDSLILRSNLTILGQKGERLVEHLKKNNVDIVASFPSLNDVQTESVRGRGIFQAGVEALIMLNALGYGISEDGPELNLVSNPAGAYLTPAQAGLEKRFKDTLKNKWGIRFNRLYSFANVPLGRFRAWLSDSGNLDAYMNRLAASFNPDAVSGLMCRALMSVSWDGYVYDCDFNLAAGLFSGSQKTHITEITGPPAPGSPVAVADHCYTCAAGAGFT